MIEGLAEFKANPTEHVADDVIEAIVEIIEEDDSRQITAEGVCVLLSFRFRDDMTGFKNIAEQLLNTVQRNERGEN